MAPAAKKRARHSPALLLRPQLQPRFVLLQERLHQQPDSVLVVQRHRKAPKDVDAHAALLADLKRQAGWLSAFDLRFEFGDPRQQFFFGRVRHARSVRGQYSARRQGARELRAQLAQV